MERKRVMVFTEQIKAELHENRAFEKDKGWLRPCDSIGC